MKKSENGHMNRKQRAFPKLKSARGPRRTIRQICALFDAYQRQHSAGGSMRGYAKLFIPGALAVRTADDGKIITFSAQKLARDIAAEARRLASQYVTYDDVWIDAEGDAAGVAATWHLFHNGRRVRSGRAYYSLVRLRSKWRIASLVWYRRAGGGVR